MKISFDACQGVMNGVVLVPVLEGDGVPSRIQAEDKKGAIIKVLKADGFTGKKGDRCVVTVGDLKVILVGVGAKADVTEQSLQMLGGDLVAIAKGAKRAQIKICTAGLLDLDMPVSAHIAFGVGLGAYTFDVYKTDKKKDVELEDIIILSPDPRADEKAFDPLAAIMDGVYEARDLISEPANAMMPADFVDAAEHLGLKDLTVSVLDKKQMARLGMNLLLGVARGSEHDPYLLTVSYMKGKSKDAPILLVGKGVCFDSGGMNLKPAAGLGHMKYDMAGAAAVLGTMIALAKMKASVNVVAVMPLVENSLSSTAQRTGDVVTSMSGKTVEIGNTDAEGRLILADALWYGQQTFKPKVVLDIATLTGAMKAALGDQFAGLFSNSETLAFDVKEAGDETAMDKVWWLPMTDAFDKMIDSDIADMNNVAADSAAGSSTAAHFIKRFVQDGVSWAHIDMAGMAWTDKGTPLAPKGATGYGVQLLTRFVLNTMG